MALVNEADNIYQFELLSHEYQNTACDENLCINKVADNVADLLGLHPTFLKTDSSPAFTFDLNECTNDDYVELNNWFFDKKGKGVKFDSFSVDWPTDKNCVVSFYCK